MLTHQYLERARKTDVAWKLLSSNNAPFVASFFHRVFIAEDRRSINYPELHSLLDDYLYELKESLEDRAPRASAREYIENWSRGENPYLSQRYRKDSEVAEVDITAGAEKAIRWLEKLKGREFVGTESRLLSIFEILQDLTDKTQTDREKVLKRLEEKKFEIESQMEQVKNGEVLTHNKVQIKERLFQLEDLMRELLSDFRVVEENFRTLDRDVREKAISTEKRKGEFISDVFLGQDAIDGSDQGRSFKTFWEIILQNDITETFRENIENILAQNEAREHAEQNTIREFYQSLLMAGTKIKRVQDQLTSQLRKFLDDQTLLEGKRVKELTDDIEKLASNISKSSPTETFSTIAQLSPELNLEMSRPFYHFREAVELKAPEMTQHSAEEENLSLSALFNVKKVDEKRLRAHIQKALGEQTQVTLKNVTEKFPIQQGLAEIVTYLKMASESEMSHFNKEIEEKLFYTDENSRQKFVRLEQVLFTREVN